MSPTLAGRFLTTGPLGKPKTYFLNLMPPPHWGPTFKHCDDTGGARPMGTWAPSHLGHPHPCPLMPVLQRALLGPTTHPSWPRHPWSVLVRCEDQGGHVQALHLAPGQNFSEGLAYCPGDRGMSSSFHCGFVLGEAVQSMDGAWAWNQPLSVPK